MTHGSVAVGEAVGVGSSGGGCGVEGSAGDEGDGGGSDGKPIFETEDDNMHMEEILLMQLAARELLR